MLCVQYLLLLAAFTAANATVVIQPAPLDCSVIHCENPTCGEDEKSVIPTGQCCRICVPIDDCTFTICPLVKCAVGYRSVIPEGECCAICKPDCSRILCALPLCAGNSRPIVPKGECCPKCQLDCSAVLCLRPDCKPGETLVTPDGECCPKCQLNCSLANCVLPTCRPGERVVTPQGECCSKCQLDCSLVDCALPTCTTGQRVMTPEGKCCPTCVPDPSCAAVSCLNPVCPAGQVAKVPNGECCPVCVCEIGGQTFSDCASACPKTCEQPNIACRAMCRPGCECPRGQVIDRTNKICVPAEECPAACPVRGQTLSFCAGCETTCNQIINGELRLCPAVCRVGCSCPGGQVVDTMNNECVTADECPNPCETVVCKSGARCKVFEATGEAFCDPSCSISNGGCSPTQTCSLETVQCVRAPCPPVVKCTDPDCTSPPDPGPCRAAFRRFFYNATSKQCERFVYGGCQGNKNNFMTSADCESKCSDPCETVVCKSGARCKVFEETGETFCDPSCSISNGGCSPTQTCSLEMVQCVRAPCPPVVKCTDPDCTSSPDPGPCRAAFRRFFYNATSKQCERFVYGGCQGNKNNFMTSADCENKCSEPTVSPCATIRCANGFRCEVFQGEGFCQPDCSFNNGGCPTNQTCRLENVVCIRAPCPPNRICEDPPATTTCPPPCSKKLCDDDRSAICSNPGPREIPGCTGTCQFSNCRHCYVRDVAISPPPGQCRLCSNLADYTSDTRCYRSWSRCTRRAHRRLYGKPDFDSEEAFRCYNPPCPRRG